MCALLALGAEPEHEAWLPRCAVDVRDARQDRLATAALATGQIDHDGHAFVDALFEQHTETFLRDVEHSSVEELSAAIEKLSGDAALRERLRSAGLERAAGISWKHTAEKTMERLARIAER